MNYENEIIIGAAGLMTTAAGWLLGGRQTSRRKNTTIIADGAAKLIETGQGLLDYVQKERDAEAAHKTECQKALQEYAEKFKEQEAINENLQEQIKRMITNEKPH